MRPLKRIQGFPLTAVSADLDCAGFGGSGCFNTLDLPHISSQDTYLPKHRSIHGGLAQLGERDAGSVEVRSSILLGSTISFFSITTTDPSKIQKKSLYRWLTICVLPPEVQLLKLIS